MKTGSQIFDFKRYTDCLKRDVALNSRSWLLRAALMTAITTFLLIFATWPNFMDRDTADTYIAVQLEGGFTMLRICMFIYCAFGASLFMENMTTNGQRINELMSPASTLEKYLSRWTVCVVGVTVAFFICFSIAALLRVPIIYILCGDVPGMGYYGPFELLGLAEKWYMPWCAMMAVQATFVLGSTIWPKHTFQKTFGVMFVLQIALILCALGATNIIWEPGYYKITRPVGEWLMNNVFVLIAIGTTIWSLFCYIVAYYRLRESEVINRF